jgi:hypothetical protein
MKREPLKKSEVLRLLKEQCCLTCRFSWKSSTVVTFIDKSIQSDHPVRKSESWPAERICDYENIMINRPKGRESPMSKQVDDFDHCEKYERR